MDYVWCVGLFVTLIASSPSSIHTCVKCTTLYTYHQNHMEIWRAHALVVALAVSFWLHDASLFGTQWTVQTKLIRWANEIKDMAHTWWLWGSYTIKTKKQKINRKGKKWKPVVPSPLHMITTQSHVEYVRMAVAIGNCVAYLLGLFMECDLRGILKAWVGTCTGSHSHTADKVFSKQI